MPIEVPFKLIGKIPSPLLLRRRILVSGQKRGASEKKPKLSIFHFSFPFSRMGPLVASTPLPLSKDADSTVLRRTKPRVASRRIRTPAPSFSFQPPTAPEEAPEIFFPSSVLRGGLRGKTEEEGILPPFKSRVGGSLIHRLALLGHGRLRTEDRDRTDGGAS